MRSSNKTMWVAVISVLGLALASMSSADTITRSSRSKGMGLLTVAADSGGDIWEVNVAVLGGRVRDYRTPPGWFAEADGPFVWWWTDDYNCRIADGTSLSGFGVKVTGRGWATWQTFDGVGNFIDQGNLRLKGRLY